jgi:hypothetical protein
MTFVADLPTRWRGWRLGCASGCALGAKPDCYCKGGELEAGGGGSRRHPLSGTRRVVTQSCASRQKERVTRPAVRVPAPPGAVSKSLRAEGAARAPSARFAATSPTDFRQDLVCSPSPSDRCNKRRCTAGGFAVSGKRQQLTSRCTSSATRRSPSSCGRTEATSPSRSASLGTRRSRPPSTSTDTWRPRISSAGCVAPVPAGMPLLKSLA